MIRMKRIPPLLITASLDPGETPQVALRDVRQRTLRHMEGLIAWLRDPYVERVVFAKNCALPIRTEVLIRLAECYRKELEFVQVASSPLTPRQGKGFGEGDLIRQALEKSELLRASHDFFKITGKLFMPDVSSVFTGEGEGEFFVATNHDEPSVFPLRHLVRGAYRDETLGMALALMRKLRMPWEWIAAVPSGWIDTRCYRCGVGYYRDHLLHTHKRVRDALGYTLENSVFDDLRYSWERIRLITITPTIVGMSGTLATQAAAFSNNLQSEASELTDRLLSF